MGEKIGVSRDLLITTLCERPCRDCAGTGERDADPDDVTTAG